jgi:MarR family transcriptional regulator for hemolysin
MANDADAYQLRDMTRDLLQAGRLWRKIARAAAARHGVSEAASSPLIWIDRLGPDLRQNALAEAVGIEGASLVRLIDELEQSGIITRTPDPSDRRANCINLTRKGREVVGEVTEELAALRASVFAKVTPEDMIGARNIFEAIRAAADPAA